MLKVLESIRQAAALEVRKETCYDRINGAKDGNLRTMSAENTISHALFRVRLTALLLPLAAPKAVRAAATIICSPRALLISLAKDL